MALTSIAYPSLNFSSSRSMFKPYFTLRNPSSSVAKITHTASAIQCGSDDATVVNRGYARIDAISDVRRSGNYPPPLWNYDFLQSLNSNFKVGVYSSSD